MLTTLDLSGTRISHQGVRYLTDSLLINRVRSVLFSSINQIDHEGAQCLANVCGCQCGYQYSARVDPHAAPIRSTPYTL